MRLLCAILRGAQPLAGAGLLALVVSAAGCDESAESAGTPLAVAGAGSGDAAHRVPSVSMQKRPATGSGPVETRVDGQPVAAKMRLSNSDAAPGDELELIVELSIAPMWEIQPLEAAAGGATATQLELRLPPGITALGEWASPKTGRSTSPDGHAVHAGRPTFTRALTIAASAPAGPATISCNVAFQACNDRTCLKPQALEIALSMTIVEP